MTEFTKFNEIQELYTGVCTTLEKYNNDKISLKKSKLSELYTKKSEYEKAMKTACPHDQTHVYRGTLTDIGYGLDRHYTHYDLYCTRCNTYLLLNTDGGKDDRWNVFGPASLEDAIQAFRKHENISDEDLRKLGYMLRTVTTSTTTLIKN